MIITNEPHYNQVFNQQNQNLTCFMKKKPFLLRMNHFPPKKCHLDRSPVTWETYWSSSKRATLQLPLLAKGCSQQQCRMMPIMANVLSMQEWYDTDTSTGHFRMAHQQAFEQQLGRHHVVSALMGLFLMKCSVLDLDWDESICYFIHFALVV